MSRNFLCERIGDLVYLLSHAKTNLNYSKSSFGIFFGQTMIMNGTH